MTNLRQVIERTAPAQAMADAGTETAKGHRERTVNRVVTEVTGGVTIDVMIGTMPVAMTGAAMTIVAATMTAAAMMIADAMTIDEAEEPTRMESGFDHLR